MKKIRRRRRRRRRRQPPRYRQRTRSTCGGTGRWPSCNFLLAGRASPTWLVATPPQKWGVSPTSAPWILFRIGFLSKWIFQNGIFSQMHFSNLDFFKLNFFRIGFFERGFLKNECLRALMPTAPPPPTATTDDDGRRTTADDEGAS